MWVKSDFDWSNERWMEINSKIGSERIDILKKRIIYSTKLLRMTQNELEMNYGECAELNETVKKVESYLSKIHDLKQKFEQ